MKFHLQYRMGLEYKLNLISITLSQNKHIIIIPKECRDIRPSVNCMVWGPNDTTFICLLRFP